jgi:hypothetical protein
MYQVNIPGTRVEDLTNGKALNPLFFLFFCLHRDHIPRLWYLGSVLHCGTDPTSPFFGAACRGASAPYYFDNDTNLGCIPQKVLECLGYEIQYLT